jgi:hypothetical protein
VYGLSCTHLMRCLLRVPGEAMMSLMSGTLGMLGHASEAEGHRARGGARALPHREGGLKPQDTWRYRSPSLSGGSPGASNMWRRQSLPAQGAKSSAVGLDLSLVHGVPDLQGTDICGYSNKKEIHLMNSIKSVEFFSHSFANGHYS